MKQQEQQYYPEYKNKAKVTSFEELQREASQLLASKVESRENEVNIQPQVKFVPVYLKYVSFCGCGGDDVEIKRYVHPNSSFKDGDYVYELIDGDQIKGTDY